MINEITWEEEVGSSGVDFHEQLGDTESQTNATHSVNNSWSATPLVAVLYKSGVDSVRKQKVSESCMFVVAKTTEFFPHQVTGVASRTVSSEQGCVPCGLWNWAWASGFIISSLIHKNKQRQYLIVKVLTLQQHANGKPPAEAHPAAEAIFGTATCRAVATKSLGIFT